VSIEVDYYENFQNLEKKIWSMLNEALIDRNSPFRIPVFICGNKLDFDGRIVVLRGVDETNKLVQYHSDIRSGKIDKLINNKNAAMLFYDKKEKIQIRIKVDCVINQNNDITKESWSKTQHISRKCYLVDNAPGTESLLPTSGLKSELDSFGYTKEQGEEGYKNFTVIQCKIKTIEWLYLAAKGHRRAFIDYTSSKKYSWLTP
tara:strand:- start:614 stop:1222 length:609 start_codon:yes stop_codon:yes gene_type:complete